MGDITPSPPPPASRFNLSAKQAGTFFGALVVALVLGLGSVADSSKSSPSGPTAAEFDAMAKLVRANATAIQRDGEETAKVRTMIEDHLKYSNEKVESFAGKFSALKAWEVSHEQRENSQDELIRACCFRRLQQQ